MIMTIAGVKGIRYGFHGPTDVTPVSMTANLHLGLAIHNFGIQEYMPHSDVTLEVFRTSYRFEDGLLHPGEAPGLGVELDREAAAAHEIGRASCREQGWVEVRAGSSSDEQRG